MAILVTNDDGIHAPGLDSLARSLVEIEPVVVVAPDREQSSVGHAITLSKPIRIMEMSVCDKYSAYAITGTPTDAVKIATKIILPEKPTLLVSGINLGPNTGTALIYSGTVSAATEGTMLGIPSFAISLNTRHEPDFTYAAKAAKIIAMQIIERGLPRGVFLNVNVPALPENAVQGFKVAIQGDSFYADFFEKRLDPRGGIYYWMAGTKERLDKTGKADYTLLDQGYVTITPVHYDLTAYDYLDELNRWDINKGP
ncbi:5'/3'-nucleotidase SurE [bacterium]|nr:5'/3'-nucleotidase SurE [bacterium]